MIEITGYVTEPRGEFGFTLKITDDNVENEKGIHPEVSKEIEVFIPRGSYPDDLKERLGIADDYQKKLINECVSIGRQLKKGDRVKCCAFIVASRGSDYNDKRIYTINNDINSIETYTKYSPLWLYPNPGFFERLEVDTPETLKFRKLNYYTEINREKCEKITDNYYNKYREKWWINKNPKITFPMRGWVKVRTTASNLWRRFTGQDNLNKTLIIVTIISILFSIILASITIWSLYLRNPSP